MLRQHAHELLADRSITYALRIAGQPQERGMLSEYLATRFGAVQTKIKKKSRTAFCFWNRLGALFPACPSIAGSNQMPISIWR